MSSCTTGGHRYCDLYLSLAQPHGALARPTDLLYAPNHFWLAVEDSGFCHIGIDAFLAEVVGKVDDVTFVTKHHTQRPAVALTINGLEWPMTFPNPLRIEKVNVQLRGDPSRLTSDPYGSGWLFAGWEAPGRTRTALITGPNAAAWEAEEREKLTCELHDKFELSCDGGQHVRGVAELMSRQARLYLLQRFFSSRPDSLT